MRAIIFANGPIQDPHTIHSYLKPDDLILAADGGASHCLRLGITPQVVIGDFDSLQDDEIALLSKASSQIIRYPQRKDFTDLELALLYACQLTIKEALIFGALGSRWDQTLANLLLPALPELQCFNIRLIDGTQEIRLLRPGQTNIIGGVPGDIVSLIPIGGDVSGIHSENLEYPLNHDTLRFGASRGVSNQLTASSATISMEFGLLICTIIHQTMDRK